MANESGDHESFRMQRDAVMELLRAVEEQTKRAKEQTRQFELEAKTRRETSAALDRRVDNLVSAIGEYVSRLPPLPSSQS